MRSIFADLEQSLRRLLEEDDWDAVVHLAAVGDYHVARVTVDGRPFPPGGPGKIGSAERVDLTLKPNPKLLDSLRNWSRNPGIRVVGFKLTDTPDPEERADQVARLFRRGGPDLVVHNDIRDITPDIHPAVIHDRNGVRARTDSKEELARTLLVLLEGDSP